MNADEQALGIIVGRLKRIGIPFMLTGSVATSYHGRPRATHDADVVIDPTPPQLDILLQDLDTAGFYVDPEGARRALRDRTQFNAIEMTQASKIDFIIRRDRSFSHEEFRRRMIVDLSFARAVPLVTPEDAIVSKLEWARRAGESERQLADAVGVLELNPDIDREYIARWSSTLGVGDLWSRIAAKV